MHTLESLLGALINISVPIFAIASMLSMGLRTPLRAFRKQLRDRRTVFSVLGANFVVVPAVGTLLVWLLSDLLPQQTGEGFVIALCAAGAPFVLQLGAMARIPYGETAGPMAVLL
ncbi:MAG: Na+-dependent transporter, partial [Brachybacterium sp.]|nr:Na+-dependent transporter [Brachybacterium sp.]